MIRPVKDDIQSTVDVAALNAYPTFISIDMDLEVLNARGFHEFSVLGRDLLGYESAGKRQHR